MDVERQVQERLVRRRGNFFPGPFFASFRFFCKGLRVKLFSKILDGFNDAGRRTIHGFAYYGVAAIANGINDAPAGEAGQGVQLWSN